MSARVSIQKLDDLIDEFIQSELRFRQITRERAQADLDLRLAVVQSSANAPGFTETDRFHLQLRAENLEAEYQRLLRINCDWVFYASFLYAAKLLMAGDEMAKRPQYSSAIRMCLDAVLDAVADSTNIKRIREIDNKYLPMIVEVGTMFRSNVSKAVFEAGKK